MDEARVKPQHWWSLAAVLVAVSALSMAAALIELCFGVNDTPADWAIRLTAGGIVGVYLSDIRVWLERRVAR